MKPLIEPYGIEIIVQPLKDQIDLTPLIEPYGIEITENNAALIAAGTFNRTLWN